MLEARNDEAFTFNEYQKLTIDDGAKRALNNLLFCLTKSGLK